MHKKYSGCYGSELQYVRERNRLIESTLLNFNLVINFLYE